VPAGPGQADTGKSPCDVYRILRNLARQTPVKLMDNGMDTVSLSLGLTPHGRLVLAPDADAPPLDRELVERLRQALERGSGHGILLLGAAEVGTALPPSCPTGENSACAM